MDKLWPTALIAIVVVLIFVGMWVGWRRRARRDSAIEVPTALAEPGETLLTVKALHVGSTHHDHPLDRVVGPGLAFRANATVTVSAGGITISAPGERSVAIAANAILGAGTATWTIDRTVERDGLVLVAWHSGGGSRATDADGPVIDTYLRTADAVEQGRLVAGIHSLAGTPVNPGQNGTLGADDVAPDTTTGSEA
ncbi:transporter [Humibacter antri]